MREIESEFGRLSRGAGAPQSMTSAGGAVVFSDYRLDLDSGRLLRGEEEIPLRPKSFAVLQYLVVNAGRLVSRDELLSAIWPDTIVTDDSLTHCITDIRRGLGENGVQVIRTVPRRGYLFSASVTEVADSSGPPHPRHGRGAPARSRHVVAAVALVLAVASAWWISREAPAPDAQVAVQAPPNSIAVLRFADMSPERDQAYLADGLAHEILHLLAQIPELQVIARTSSFAVEGDDIATVAAKLNVAHVLEGSVRKSGQHIRVTAQLVDAATSAHQWSKTYERGLNDLFAVQAEIAGEVANALHVTLVDDTDEADTSAPDPRAYELYLMGHFLYNRRTAGDVERARELYEQALAMDSGLARAWIGLAAIYNFQRWSQRGHQPLGVDPGMDVDVPVSDLAERHAQAVEYALRLAPTLPEAHVRAAHYYGLSGDRAKRIEHLEQAQALDPGHPLVLSHVSLGHLLSDRDDEAIAAIQRAMQRDPLSAVTRSNLAATLASARRYDEAITEYRKILALGSWLFRGDGRVEEAVMGIARMLLLQRRLDEALERIEAWPAGEDRDYGLAMLYHALAQPAQADAALQRLVASAGTSYPLRIAEAHAYRGANHDALAWLQPIDVDCRRNPYAPLRAFHSPFLALMRADPRWQAWRTDTGRALRECF